MKLKHLFENDFENEVPKITEPYEAYMYAFNLRKRIPKLEPIIMKDGGWIYAYVRDIIKGRWPEAEPTIIKDPECAYKYAKYILKRRWPEAEPVIMKDPGWANDYLRNFPEARTPSKNVPLVLSHYMISDVPNTITDEQVMKLVRLIEPNVKKHNVDQIPRYRTYYEPLITLRRSRNKLTKISTKQLMNSSAIREEFLKSIQCDDIKTDFE